MIDPDLEQRIAAATAVFQKDVGVWDVELEIRPAPGASPLRQTAVSTNRRIGGGRWLVVEHCADSGFEGHGIYGWDPDTGKYVGAWVYSMQTSVARCEGTWDPTTRTMTFTVEATHGGQSMRYREITETRDDGTQVYRNLAPTADGGEFEMIRATYHRRPG